MVSYYSLRNSVRLIGILAMVRDTTTITTVDYIQEPYKAIDLQRPVARSWTLLTLVASNRIWSCIYCAYLALVIVWKTYVVK